MQAGGNTGDVRFSRGRSERRHVSPGRKVEVTNVKGMEICCLPSLRDLTLLEPMSLREVGMEGTQF